MALYDPAKELKNREWRRFVRVKARIKFADGWRDASILNVSSRGMMINSSCSPDPGRPVEIRSGDQAIHGRVFWKKGQRVGLRSDTVLPVVDIISLSEAGAQSDDPRPVTVDRRRRPRTDEVGGLLWPRFLELASTLLIAGGVAAGFLSIGAAKLSPALSLITSAL